MRSDWFLHNWMYAGFLAGLFLLAIAPVLAAPVGLPLLLVYLQLPVYMLPSSKSTTTTGSASS